MMGNLPPFQALMIRPLEVMGSLAGVYVHGADKIAAETWDFSRAAFRSNAEGFDKALGAKSVSELVKVQGDQARENLNSTVGEMERIGGILLDLSRDTVKSVLQPAIQQAAERAEEAERSETRGFKHYPEYHHAA